MVRLYMLISYISYIIAIEILEVKDLPQGAVIKAFKMHLNQLIFIYLHIVNIFNLKIQKYLFKSLRIFEIILKIKARGQCHFKICSRFFSWQIMVHFCFKNALSSYLIKFYFLSLIFAILIRIKENHSILKHVIR